jgi:hypothetical protein
LKNLNREKGNPLPPFKAQQKHNNSTTTTTGMFSAFWSDRGRRQFWGSNHGQTAMKATKSYAFGDGADSRDVDEPAVEVL